MDMTLDCDSCRWVEQFENAPIRVAISRECPICADTVRLVE